MIVQYLLATACLLFVLSLPLGKLPIASTLRRSAGLLFLLAFLPSLFFGLIAPPAPAHATPGTPEPGCSFSAIIGFIILSLLSYGILEARKRLRPGKSIDAWSDYVSLRTAGKRPAGDARSAHTPGLFEDSEVR